MGGSTFPGCMAIPADLCPSHCVEFPGLVVNGFRRAVSAWIVSLPSTVALELPPVATVVAAGPCVWGSFLPQGKWDGMFHFPTWKLHGKLFFR